MSCRALLYRGIYGVPSSALNRLSARLLLNPGLSRLSPTVHRQNVHSVAENGLINASVRKALSSKNTLDRSADPKKESRQLSEQSRTPAPLESGNHELPPATAGAANKRFGLHLLLSDDQEKAVLEHRNSTESLRRSIESIAFVDPADVELLRAQVERLDDGLFLLVLVGEYNSGKSSCINALVGRRIMEEGLIPTTSEITILRYGKPSASSLTSRQDKVIAVTQDIELLKTISLVDSPGTNAINRNHEALTKRYLPLCDFVLFITSADRPFSESERVFLKSIREWGKKCIIVVNKADLLPDEKSRQDVANYVRTSSRELLGSSPHVFVVSSRQALAAKLSQHGDSRLLGSSAGFQDLESYISNSLDAAERVRIKLDSVSSVGLTVAKKYVEDIQRCLAILTADKTAVDKVLRIVDECHSSTIKGFDVHFAPVDNALLELLERADTFFDSNVSLANISMLLRKDAIANLFAEQVVQGTARDVENQSRILAEWVANRTSRNMSEAAVIFSSREGERRGLPSDQLSTQTDNDSALTLRLSIDDPIGMEKLMTGLSNAASQLASSYDAHIESRKLASELSSAVTTVIAVELSAVGLLGAWMTSSMLDLTGIASTSALVTAGAVILPRRRHVLRTELRKTINALRSRLKKEVLRRVQEHMDLHKEHVLAGVEPFASRTTAKVRCLQNQMQLLRECMQGLNMARDRVQSLTATQEYTPASAKQMKQSPVLSR